jgi:mono/diheme cytochrome c family protein
MKSLIASFALALSFVACGGPMPGNDAGSDSGSTPTDTGVAPTDSGSTPTDGSAACLPTGNAAAGAMVAMGGCGSCHGADLGGGTTPPGSNLHNEAMRAGSWSDCAFQAAMRTGTAPGGRTLCASMPRFNAQTLSDQQLADLLAHLRTLTTAGRTVAACN